MNVKNLIINGNLQNLSYDHSTNDFNYSVYGNITKGKADLIKSLSMNNDIVDRDYQVTYANLVTDIKGVVCLLIAYHAKKDKNITGIAKVIIDVDYGYEQLLKTCNTVTTSNDKRLYQVNVTSLLDSTVLSIEYVDGNIIVKRKIKDIDVVETLIFKDDTYIEELVVDRDKEFLTKLKNLINEYEMEVFANINEGISIFNKDDKEIFDGYDLEEIK